MIYPVVSIIQCARARAHELPHCTVTRSAQPNDLPENKLPSRTHPVGLQTNTQQIRVAALHGRRRPHAQGLASTRGQHSLIGNKVCTRRHHIEHTTSRGGGGPPPVASPIPYRWWRHLYRHYCCRSVARAAAAVSMGTPTRQPAHTQSTHTVLGCADERRTAGEHTVSSLSWRSPRPTSAAPSIDAAAKHSCRAPPLKRSGRHLRLQVVAVVLLLVGGRGRVVLVGVAGPVERHLLVRVHDVPHTSRLGGVGRRRAWETHCAI